MIVVFLLVILALVGLIHWYLWARLVRATTEPGTGWRRAGTVLVIVLAVLLPVTLAGRALPMAQQRLLAWPGYLWLALMFLLVSTLVVLEVPRLVLRRWAAPRPQPALVPAGAGAPADPEAGAPADADPNLAVPDPSRRLLLARSLASVAGVVAAGTVGYGVHTAMGTPRLARRQITLAKLPRTMDGFRIALVSDIHLGPLLGRGHTERIVDIINRLDPDIVAVVGDLVDGTVAELGSAAEPLAGLRSRHGSFFVTGNHEYFSGYREWITEVGSFGFTALRNQRVEVAGLDLAGVNDITGGGYGDGPDYDRALAGRDPAKPVVLLAHQPIQVHEAEKRGVDLQLSGHTHGGQIFPFGYVVRLQQPVLAGYARFGATQLYVTRGAGFWGPPVRVGAPPDVTLIELRAT
jgi:predicted MPP superfamily phosphohydrolase